MLQRAANSAYSWWWASHVRTKQSKWLEENLEDMEEKVTMTLEIIEAGGDSFSQRAEMYYRKRPELINFVEELFRAYRALAERYDHLSRDFQTVNRTIATVYPDKVHELPMDVEDEENASRTASISTIDQSRQTNHRVPKNFRRSSMANSRKGSHLGRISSSVKVIPSSGLTRKEALEEIYNLEKSILGLQTEKEFVNSLYEHGYQKFWKIEDQIAVMQQRVNSLKDEFDIRTVIEDDEARSIMAGTALKSCQETLFKLQEKLGQSKEETTVEQRNITDAQDSIFRLREKFPGKQTDKRNESKEENEDEEIVGMVTDDNDSKMLRQKIKKKFNFHTKSTLTVAELAENINELVYMVVSLETEVSSHAAMVKRLSSQTDQLQSKVRNTENDNVTFKEGSNNMRRKLIDLEEELQRIKALNRSLIVQNSNLKAQFTEASCNIDHLSEKLHSVKLVDESNREKGINVEVVEEEKQEAEKEDLSPVLGNLAENQINLGNCSGIVPVEVEDQTHEMGEEEFLDKQREISDVEKEGEDDDGGDRSNLRQMFLKGLEDRENILLEEYTSVLKDYKEVKKKLSEMEIQNRESIFGLAKEIRQLKSDIASKDDVIKSLIHKYDYTEQTNPDDSPFTYSVEYINQDVLGDSSNETPSLNLDLESVSGELGVQNVQTLANLMASTKDLKSSNANDVVEEMVEKIEAPIPHSVSSIEEKFRYDIDKLLEANLEFWLRFSTSVHQIQKFETSVEDLQLDLLQLKESHNRTTEGLISSKQRSMQSDARLIYRHLREIQIEMSLWSEHNDVLQDELQGRFSSLCNIQDEIERVSRAISEGKMTRISTYKAAKFQGEVLNMKQENNKVADELKVGLNRVKGLKVEVEMTLAKLNEKLGIFPKKNDYCRTTKQPSYRARIPLRSFLFGVKLKRQKASIFSWVSPALQKQHRDLETSRPLPI